MGPGLPPQVPVGDPVPFDAFRVTSAPSGGPPPAPGVGFREPPQAPTAPRPGPGQLGGEAEQPAPQIRNGRVLLAVLCAAVLLLVVPLGIVWLLTRSSGPSFDVGSCVRRSGSEAVAAQCSDSDAYTVVAKVDNQTKCTDPPGQPYVVVSDGSKNNVLCLRPATN
jgi:hypothetical protein